MAYEIKDIVTARNVPAWGNQKKFIAIHYLGVDGQNNDIAPDGCGAHYYIYWDGTIYKRCSHDAVVWQVGTAGTYTQKHPTARNANTIGIELCCHCDGNKASADDPKWYFTEATQKAAVWLVQKLMKELSIPITNVLRHYDIVNKVCPAPYVHNNRYKGTWTWREFLEAVQGTTPAEVKWYRVRKSWKDEKSQLGAYEVLENAKDNCPVGYSVYDSTGKAVYTPVDGISAAQGHKYPSGVPASKEAYIEAVGSICKELAKETGVLASVVTAQCCLETGFGLDPSCKSLMDVSNLLGMKSNLINNTWEQYTVWSGKEITKKTPEYYNGKLVYITDHFRAYENYERCIRDYEMFLLHVRNSKGYKYASVRGMTDPAAVIRRIRIGTGTDAQPEGYCTDPAYEGKVLNLIKEYDLTRFDTKKSQPAPVEIVDRYAVRHDAQDIKYQLGLFHVLDNAKALANQNWGYKVYDITNNKLIYEPKLTAAQKLVAECVYMDLIVRDDIKAGRVWQYKNKNTKKLSRTFDLARKEYNFKTNCSTAVYWALLRSGVVNSNRDGIQWNGKDGFVWLNSHAKKDALKYFKLISVRDKTMRKCMGDGTVQPGDVISFVGLAHTCIYIGQGLTYDTGHHNCSGSGEGAKFKCWASKAGYQNYKVAEMLRPK